MGYRNLMNIRNRNAGETDLMVKFGAFIRKTNKRKVAES